MQGSNRDRLDQLNDDRMKLRHEVYLEIGGSDSNGRPYHFKLRNVSATGLLVESEQDFRIDEVLSFTLPETGVRDARVAWKSEGLFGCEFSEQLTEGSVAALRLKGQPSKEGCLNKLQVVLPPKTEPLNELLARLRREAGLTLGDVATALNVSKPTVWAWERGKSRPLPERLEAISKLYDIAAEYLRDGLGQDEDSARLVIEECRIRIAKACKTDPSAVRLMIEL